MCSKQLDDDAGSFPFCSSRCKLLDLGNWLGERYRIPVDDEKPSEVVAEGGESPPATRHDSRRSLH